MTYIQVCACMHIYIYTCVKLCKHKLIHTDTPIYMDIHTYTQAFMYIQMSPNYRSGG